MMYLCKSCGAECRVKYCEKCDKLGWLGAKRELLPHAVIAFGVALASGRAFAPHGWMEYGPTEILLTTAIPLGLLWLIWALGAWWWRGSRYFVHNPDVVLGNNSNEEGS